MNPYYWKVEHQIAWIIAIVMGAIGGLLMAWIQSPFSHIASVAASGDPFGDWLFAPDTRPFWPLTPVGALLAGLGYYAAMLFRVPLRDQAKTDPAKKARPVKGKPKDQPTLF